MRRAAALHGPLTVTATSGPVVLGNLGTAAYAACAANQVWGPVTLSGNRGGVQLDTARLQGPVTLSVNTGGTEVAGNKVSGPLSCTANSPAPVDASRPNAVTGPRSGQCSIPGF